MCESKRKTNPRIQVSGFTMVEMVVVILLIALIAWAVFPLLKTSFEAWEIADRRTEIAQIGRVGMSQFTREIRKARDLTDASEPTYIDYNPIWASSSEYRFEYATTEYKFNHGATSGGSFSSNTLSYPVDDFTYVPYSRRLISSGVTRARRVNFIWASMDVSDERRRLPATLDPRSFRSMVQMRIAREGYFLAKSIDFATQSYVFDRSNCDYFCAKAYCDRIDPPMTSTTIADASVTIDWGAGNAGMLLEYVSNGDYYATCCAVSSNAQCAACGGCAYDACDIFADPKGGGAEFWDVTVSLDGGTEVMQAIDKINVQE